MKKSTPIYAIIFIVLSIASFITGFWAGTDEKEEAERYFVNYVESSLEASANRTLKNLKMLIALKEGNKDIVVEILTGSVRSGLRKMPEIGHPGVDYLAKLSEPTESTKMLAIEYQKKYCQSKCLGI